MKIYIVRSDSSSRRFYDYIGVVHCAFTEKSDADSKAMELEKQLFVEKGCFYELKRADLEQPDWFIDFSIENKISVSFNYWLLNDMSYFSEIDKKNREELFDLLVKSKAFKVFHFHVKQIDLYSEFE